MIMRGDISMRVAFIIVVLGLTVAAPAERQWVGGSGVNSDWWWYGNSDTVHGDYNDSNSPDAAGRAAHDSIANDPNAGLNHPGTPGNDEIAQASAAMDAAQARVERAFESSPEWTNAVADSESGKRAYHKARAEVVKALSERADYTSAAEASAAADRTVESSRATTTATQAEMHA
ncbi:MAG TPA: hypothetical protein VLI90_15140, partial [Tepidisphaeraceae bacterium]|nr:hypothetical protein [Tepidisphaeraceae bacterium]